MEAPMLNCMPKHLVTLVSFLPPFFLAGCASSDAEVSIIDTMAMEVVLMETSDIHCNAIAYDYYKDSAVDGYGLAKVYSLVKEVRKNYPEAMLIDNGDLIQGSLLCDALVKNKNTKTDAVHPIIKAMNIMKYDVANLGNHDFNYGLDHLSTTYRNAKFPYINSNLYIDDRDRNLENDKPYFNPYVIVEKVIGDQKIRVGFLGTAPAQIVNWDKAHLDGKVVSKDPLEIVRRYVPEMKKAGADIVVVVSHGGINPLPYRVFEENPSLHIAKTEGIDVVLTGHSHLEFPGKRFEGQETLGIDSKKGTLHGKPAVMPGFWGSHLGIVKLKVAKGPNGWKVMDSTSEIKSVMGVEAAQEIVEATKLEHEETLRFVRAPLGKADSAFQTYFSRIEDSGAVEIVNQAQIWYVKQRIKGTELDKFPVLSASAPFKAGFGGEYTEVPAGQIAMKHASDLYLYPNTLKVVIMTTAQLKDWLEKSAGNFNQVDPNKSGDIPIVNEKFPSYNFDIIDGITYQIDITKPEGSRIINLALAGRTLTPEQRFLVATNNYRAFGGGKFPHLNGTNVVLDTTEENREILIQYIRSKGNISGRPDFNWSIAAIKPGKANLIYEASMPSKKYKPTWATQVAEVKETKSLKYKLDFSQARVGTAKVSSPLPKAEKGVSKSLSSPKKKKKKK
jgi:2',3'-cyclic-nucleotide 2'-phosphodiesterase/3'-nucleotidase